MFPLFLELMKDQSAPKIFSIPEQQHSGRQRCSVMNCWIRAISGSPCAESRSLLSVERRFVDPVKAAIDEDELGHVSLAQLNRERIRISAFGLYLLASLRLLALSGYAGARQREVNSGSFADFAFRAGLAAMPPD